MKNKKPTSKRKTRVSLDPLVVPESDIHYSHVNMYDYLEDAYIRDRAASIQLHIAIIQGICDGVPTVALEHQLGCCRALIIKLRKRYFPKAPAPRYYASKEAARAIKRKMKFTWALKRDARVISTLQTHSYPAAAKKLKISQATVAKLARANKEKLTNRKIKVGISTKTGRFVYFKVPKKGMTPYHKSENECVYTVEEQAKMAKQQENRNR